MPNRRKLVAHVAPMLVFVVLLSVAALLKKIDGAFWLRSAEYWVYPLQTVLCAILLGWYWREYDFHQAAKIGFVVFVGVLVFLIWISPQQFFRFSPRTVGFDPDIFAAQSSLYWPTVMFRLLRLIVIVPLVEEIFWRGFLLRFLINEDFDRVPFGAFSWVSFLVVAGLFGFSHAKEDWIAGVVTGLLYNIVAYRTKSLVSCVLTHSITNCLLGIWILQTKQWGFW
jgi:uncharacterized protein